MSEDTPRFHTAEAALAYEQGKRDALNEAADAIAPEWNSTFTGAAEWLRARARSGGDQ